MHYTYVVLVQNNKSLIVINMGDGSTDIIGNKQQQLHPLEAKLSETIS